MFISKEKWTELETKVNLLLNERSVEIKELREEVRKYHEIEELLKPVKLKVKKVNYSTTSETVLIEFEAPTVMLEFDDGKQTTKSDFLKSINMLNIVGLEDQMKIQKEIRKATERRTNGN